MRRSHPLERYEELVRSLILSLSTPDGLLATLEARMRDLAEQERFEEASLARDRLHALAEALERGRTHRWLVDAGELVVRDEAGLRIVLRSGSLVRDDDDAEGIGVVCARERADELSAVRSWLARNPLAIEAADRPPAEPVDGGATLARLLGAMRAASRPARSDAVVRDQGTPTRR